MMLYSHISCRELLALIMDRCGEGFPTSKAYSSLRVATSGVYYEVPHLPLDH